MKNYRKALPENVSCVKCAHVLMTLKARESIRCGLTEQRYSCAATCVSRKMTCDDATLRELPPWLEGYK